jgi:hypothetical protein
LGQPLRIGHIACDLGRSADGGLTSGHASIRLRALIPSRALVAAGSRVTVFEDRHLRGDFQSGAIFDQDVVFVHKARFDLSGVMEQLRARGVRVVLDICDHVFALPHLSQQYTMMIERADLITTPTEALAQVIRHHAAPQVRVIPDAIEGPRGTPHEGRPGTPPRLLWYGRSANLKPLIDRVERFGRSALGREVVLEVVSDMGRGVELLRQRAPDDLKLEITPWTAVANEQALARADLVVLPSDEEPSRAVKSANRMERALWSGRVPVVTPGAVYEPYRGMAAIDADPAAGVRMALGHAADWPAWIMRAQDQIAVTRSGEALAPSWHRAASEALGLEPETAQETAQETVPKSAQSRSQTRTHTVRRLYHIGGGGHGLPGYITIDHVGAPDLLVAQGAPLPLEDGAADEILAPGQLPSAAVPDPSVALADWVRVLAPGGRLIVEVARDRAEPIKTALIAVTEADPALHLEQGRALFLGGAARAARWVVTRAPLPPRD